MRDYLPGDPLRAIHWKASARQRRLQVKVFEAATTRRIALFVAADTFAAEVAGSEGDFEFALSVAASLAHDAAGRRASVGLYVNARLADTGQPASLAPGGGQGCLAAVLEHLAKVTPVPSRPFAAFLKGELCALSAGTTLVFILSRLPADLPPLLADLKRTGHPLVVIRIGERDLTSLPVGIPCHCIRRPAGAATSEAANGTANGGGDARNHAAPGAEGGRNETGNTGTLAGNPPAPGVAVDPGAARERGQR